MEAFTVERRQGREVGFLNKLLGSVMRNQSGDDSGKFTCETCGCEVDDEDDLEDGECEDCAGSEYTGDKYCCGMIYEDGEDTCMSCGEPL